MQQIHHDITGQYGSDNYKRTFLWHCVGHKMKSMPRNHSRVHFQRESVFLSNISEIMLFIRDLTRFGNLFLHFCTDTGQMSWGAIKKCTTKNIIFQKEACLTHNEMSMLKIENPHVAAFLGEVLKH